MTEKYTIGVDLAKPGTDQTVVTEVEVCSDGVIRRVLEPEQDWFFTFGSGHAHPDKYVRIRGTWSSARIEMFRRFNSAWCMQYGTLEALNPDRWGLTELKDGE